VSYLQHRNRTCTMRISSLLSATLFTALAAQAQSPTINAGNNTPAAGQIIDVFTQPTWTLPGGTGEDIDYGFWMLDSTGQKNLKYLAPSVTSSSNAVPGTNLLFTDGGSDTTFYEYSSTGVKILGQRSPLEGLFAYSDPAPMPWGPPTTPSWVPPRAWAPLPALPMATARSNCRRTWCPTRCA
jgi:hypothetical protein